MSLQNYPGSQRSIGEDIKSLDRILSAMFTRPRGKAEEWKKEISLDIEFGKVFKKRLIITNESISFDGASVFWTKLPVFVGRF